MIVKGSCLPILLRAEDGLLQYGTLAADTAPRCHARHLKIIEDKNRFTQIKLHYQTFWSSLPSWEFSITQKRPTVSVNGSLFISTVILILLLPIFSGNILLSVSQYFLFLEFFIWRIITIIPPMAA